MTYLKSYKELIVWQKAMELAKEIFRLTGIFPKSELFGIVSQMRRAVVSIPSNIAEGHGRRSTKEFNQFLAVAYGSVLELETQLTLSEDLKFASTSEFLLSKSLLIEVSKMLMSLQHKLDAKR